MVVYAEASECGRENMTAVRSGTFNIVSLSSAVTKGNPRGSFIKQTFFKDNIDSLSSAEVALKKSNFIPAWDENLSVA